jgi:hypothetical protein
MIAKHDGTQVFEADGGINEEIFVVAVFYIPIPGGVVLHFGEDGGSTTLLPGVQLEYDVAADGAVVNVRLAAAPKTA